MISGAYKLSEKLKKTAAPVTKMQAVKFANYFIRYLNTKDVFLMHVLKLFCAIFYCLSSP